LAADRSAAQLGIDQEAETKAAAPHVTAPSPIGIAT
jgi:hypothetical protein